MISLPDFSGVNVLVVGDVMLDNYLHGTTGRISPEAPVPVVTIELEESRLGGAGNVAVNVSGLGAKASLIGLCGDDATADRLESLLISSKVAPVLQRIPGSKTITKQRIMSRHQQLIRLDYEDGFPNWDAASLISVFQGELADVDAVILSDYAKGVLRHVDILIAEARKRKIPVVIDPKGSDFERYRGATMITPNMAEFEAIVGHCHSDAEIERRGIDLRERLDIGAILITRSEKGMMLLARGHAPLHLPTHAREVYDVTGAGDTVVAVLGIALGAGMQMDEGVRLSNLAAGIVVGKMGTATVSPDELGLALLPGLDEIRRGIKTEDDLVNVMVQAKQRGERVVMTNGCFDILHPGHVTYLEKARALGDRLVVAVNDDASVGRLKGPGRPVNPLGVRMSMLAALACVDWIISFSEDTPERLICRLKPDVLVKGGDYRLEDIAGGDCVMRAGGRVQTLDFLPGHSTSSMIDRIREGISQ